MELYTIAIVLHVLGAVIGVGAVTINDLQYFRAIGDKELGVAFQKSSQFYGNLIKTGLGLLVISGLYFMFSKPVLWSSEKILTKLALVGVLVINGFIINFIFEPKFTKLKPEDWSEKSPELKKIVFARLPFDIISIVSWYAVLFMGAVGRQPWKATQIIISYILLLVAVYIITKVITKKRLNS